MVDAIFRVTAIVLTIYSFFSIIIGLIGVLSCNVYVDANVLKCEQTDHNSNAFDLKYENTTCKFISQTVPCMQDNQVIRICYSLSDPTICKSAVLQDGTPAVMFSNPNIPQGLLTSGIISIIVAICILISLCKTYKEYKEHKPDIQPSMHPSLGKYYSTLQ